MSKVGGSYASVVLGVSEQVAQDRRPGQHAAQENFISDPVRGLARRWGSRFEHDLFLGGGKPLSDQQDDAVAMRVLDFTIDSREYCILYRAKTATTARNQFMFCYDKDGRQFLPVTLQSGSTFIDQLVAGGVSALTCVGRYLYIAGNSTQATYTQTNQWQAAGNASKFVAWVRAGSYSRTYTIKLTRADGTTLSASYKTMPSAYPVLHDTSGISFYLPTPPNPANTPDPEYQKKLNDSNNLYNSKVTEHIALAAEDITPENIAEKLRLALIAAGMSPGAVARVGGTVVIDDTQFVDIQCDDGADGSTFRGVGNEVAAADVVSLVHYVGKIIRVRPRGAQSKEAYYLQAYAKNGVGTGWQEVIWREAPGVVMTPQSMWAFAAIHDGQLKVADSPAALNSMAGTTHPLFKQNEVGDGASAPIPYFYGKRITMMTTFQDRLIIGADGVVNASRPGDYINFFRQTVIDIRDNDPIEMYAYGSEGDVLRYPVLFDRDLVLFGDQKQYSISGRTLLTPRNPLISVMSSHEDATQASPVASGNLVFYGKQREGRTSVHQIQVGQLTESPESVEITQQLDTFLKGRPAQLCALTSPNTLVFRTEALQGPVLYVYNYIDNAAGSERLFDSWSVWRYHQRCGVVCGVSSHRGELLLFTLRQHETSGLRVACDRQSLSTELSDKPYFDSMVRSDVLPVWHSGVPSAELSCAVGDDSHPAFLLGDLYLHIDSVLSQTQAPLDQIWVGLESDAFVTPTNPYMRDQNAKAIVNGRLTLSSVTASVAASGALVAQVTTKSGTTTRELPIDRYIGDSNNLLDTQPIVTTDAVIGIGRETRECSYTLRSKTWLPLTITALSWVGQYFNRIRRS
jgi:hypothetical protein